MPEAYRPSWQGGSGGGYTPSWAGSQPSQTKKKKGASPFGFVGNLAGDVRDALVGIPTGLVMLGKAHVFDMADAFQGDFDFEREVNFGKEVGKATWHTWSPLFRADFGEFGHRVYDHPLAPLLDAATVLTLGAGSVAKAGGALGRIGAISEGSKFAKLGKPRDVKINTPGRPDIEGGAVRHLRGNPMRRLQQQATIKLGQELSEHLPALFGARERVIVGSKPVDKTGLYRAKGEVSRLEKLYGTATQRFDNQPLHEGGLGASPTTKRYGSGLSLARDTHERREASIEKREAEALPELTIEETGQGRLRDLSDSGFATRWHKKEESRRGAAMRASKHLAAASFVQLGKKLTEEPAEAARALDKGGKRALDDHTMWMSAEKIKSEGLRPGFTYISKTPRGIGDDVHTFEDFERYFGSKGADGFGQRHTTKSRRNAVTNEKGEYAVTNEHLGRLWEKEAAESAKFVRMLYHNPTTLWKWMVLGASPRYFVNNVVGNTFMTMMTVGGLGFMRGFVDAQRQLRGDIKTGKEIGGALGEVYKNTGGPDSWLRRYWTAGLQGFGTEHMLADGVKTIRGKDLPQGVAKVANIVKQGTYPLTHKYSDELMRGIGITALVRKQPEVQALMKQGKSFDEAALAYSQDATLRHRVLDVVDDSLGQYHYFNKAEMAMRRLIPFYSWDRAIARHGVKLVLDKPGRATALAGIGTEGAEKTKELLGDIPKFLKGVIPLELLGVGDKGGKASILTTQGSNPYSTIPNIIDTVGSIATGKNLGETLGSQMNPLLSGGIETITGQSLLTGAKKREGKGLDSGIAGLYKGTAEGTPWLRLIKRAVAGTATSKDPDKPFLYNKDFAQEWQSILGFPKKQLNLKKAAELARRERGERESRKKSNPNNTF